MESRLKQEMDRLGLPQKALMRLPEYSCAARQYRGERRVSTTYCLHYQRLFGINPAVLRPDIQWPESDAPSNNPIGSSAEDLKGAG